MHRTEYTANVSLQPSVTRHADGTLRHADGTLYAFAPRPAVVCRLCGASKPADRSCDCFDNHCQ